MVSLKDIVPAAQNTINAQFIVLDKERSPQTKQGQEKSCMALVADETASVHFQLWGTECDAFEPGDIIRLTNGIFSSYNRNNFVSRAGKRGRVENIGEFTMVFVETPNINEIHWVPDPNNSSKLVQGAVISPHPRMFPP
ncbi:hypothetical protein MKX01_042630 [Papaver californicum]|nr:hypothetical protein MKX01_042630 [Papaver californicum]